MRLRFLCLVLVMVIFSLGSAFAQQAQDTITSSTPVAPPPEVKEKGAEEKKAEEFVVLKGVVKEIGKDKNYIMVEDNKVLTTKEFLEDSYLEVGDKIEITVEKSSAGLKAVSFNYIFDEESPEEVMVEEE